MRYEKGHKEATRHRILDVASASFRKDGIAAVGLAGVMGDAGLTHGGFYAHFKSKEELVAAAAASALALTQTAMAQAAEAGASPIETLIRYYLRPAHRDTPDKGCAAAALIAEIARHSIETRQLFTQHLDGLIGLVASLLPKGDADIRRQRATALFALMMGSLQMARAVPDPASSDLILQSGIEAALALAEA